MPTRMMLEIKYLDSTEATIHLGARLSTFGSEGSYTSVSWIKKNSKYGDLTAIGEALLRELHTLSGVHAMFGQYGLLVQVPRVFDLVDTLYEIMEMVGRAVNDDVEFGATLGEDAFTKPEFTLNPTREQFSENIERMLAELRQHSVRDIAEAHHLIERLTSLIGRAVSLTGFR